MLNYANIGGGKNRPLTQERSSNIELLRILSMFLVLMIHYIPSRTLPTHDTLAHDTLGTLFDLELRSICFVCVNCFILISGYFGIRWKLKSFSNLLFQILFWTIVCPLLISAATGTFNLSEFFKTVYLNCFSHWFIEAYIGLYVLAPLINSFIEKSTHRELGIFIIAFYVFSTLFGYLGKAPDINEGMSVFSLMGLYLIGAYLRRKQNGIFDLSKYVYLGVYLVTGFIMVAIAALALKVGITASPYGYLNPLIILESIALFLFFKKLNIGHIKWINYIAASSFAVYLIHGDFSISPLYQMACDYIEAHYTPSFPYALLFMAGVFIVSVMADKVRLFIYKHTLLRLLK